ncbi:hypothetical protein FOMPIDRAFT_91535 [Fomitopsis schrenkii]|uniref:Peptidase C14 caspase domain-containing protein n=1 Tax=Fomitopsis schrenkii TaxID=2126942 RepID=S8F9K6_FOMSC|nr:hypothetical protein FOMPIDRAFT_91535 [Fomitopsis schrenkii]
MEVLRSTFRRQSAHSTSSTGRQQKKALLIGIKYDTPGSPDSDTFGKLGGPHDDVFAVQRLLIDVYGYLEEDIVMLLDLEGGDRKTQPTKLNITKEIHRLVRDARPGDHLVFHFAGHSTQFTCSEHTEDDDMDEAIVPMDHSGSGKKHKLIMDNWLRKNLIDPLKPGVQLVAILDACHSGTLLDLDHNECNRLPIPWMNPGLRDNRTLRERVVRRNDTMIHSTSSSPLARCFSTVSLDAMVARLRQTQPWRTPTFNFYRSSSTPSPTDIVRGRQAKPARHGRFGGWKDALRVVIPRCKSPETLRKCNGQCELQEKPDVPLVISFASCRDEQLTWENKRAGAMTQNIVKALRDDPRPQLRTLITTLAHARHSASRSLHTAERKRRNRLKRNPQLASSPLEGVNFQTVQIASQQRLDMDATFEL